MGLPVALFTVAEDSLVVSVLQVGLIDEVSVLHSYVGPMMCVHSTSPASIAHDLI